VTELPPLGQNVYPDPANYPITTFPQEVPPPEVDPDDEGTLIYVKYSYLWRPVLMGAIDQLRNFATWQGDNAAKQLAFDRATNLKAMLATDLGATLVETPFWDNETDVEDSETAEMQPWYGQVTNPTAPPGELDFVENVALWIFTGLVAIATFEVAGVAPALAFHTTVEKFIILQKRGDVAETIRFVVDGQDAKFVNTAPYSPGDIISTEIITPQTGGGHDLLIIGGAS